MERDLFISHTYHKYIAIMIFRELDAIVFKPHDFIVPVAKNCTALGGNSYKIQDFTQKFPLNLRIVKRNCICIRRYAKLGIFSAVYFSYISAYLPNFA